MQSIKTIGLDIAKSVFQVHGVDAAGQVVVRRQLKRRAVLAFFQKAARKDPQILRRSAAARQSTQAEGWS
jgi:transposase